MRGRAAPSLPRLSLLGAASLVYVLATGVGLLMRAALLGVDPLLPFDHLLHAHSHTLSFGWLGLAIWALVGRVLPLEAGLRRVVAAGGLAVLPMGAAFLVSGYAPASIGLSTLLMLLWYLAIARWWRQTRHERRDGVSHVRAGFAYLVGATLGVWALAALQSSGRGDPMTEALALHAFLNGFGWFVVLATVGILLLHTDRLGLAPDPVRLRRALRWWVALAWVTFPLSVPGGPELPLLGPLARAAGLLLLVPAFHLVSALWGSPGHSSTRLPVRAMALWFALHSGATAVVAAAGSEVLLWAGRDGVVLVLHALLAGFVTTGLVLVALEGRDPLRPLLAHTASLGVMLAGLALALSGAPGANWVTGTGAVALWLSGVAWASLLLRPLPAPPEPAIGHLAPSPS